MPRIAHRQYDKLAAFDEAQDVVISRADLAGLGWNHDDVQHAVNTRRWATYGTRAVVLHRGPLTRRQRWWVAFINTGPRAVLTGLTAAEEQGLRGFETDTVHVVVPKDVWVPKDRSGVVVHRSRRLRDSDRHPARVIPTVRIERALVDAAAFTASRRRACAVVMSGVQQRLTRPDLLRTTLLAQGMVRHRKLLLAVLHDVDGGVHARSELDFARFCRRNRMPEPVRQVKRTDNRARARRTGGQNPGGIAAQRRGRGGRPVRTGVAESPVAVFRWLVAVTGRR